MVIVVTNRFLVCVFCRRQGVKALFVFGAIVRVIE